jgi:PmbA protein
VLALRKPKRSKAYSGAVFFSDEAFTEIFLEPLLDAIDGDTVWKGKSQLKDKLTERIAAPGFTLVDDGTRAGALGSAPFDREGVPHRRTVIVGDGVLHRFLYDGKSANRAKTLPTGHASGSARSLPGIGTTNLAIATGDQTDAALLRTLKTGLLVGRFSGNVDAVSGDFSGVAKGSFWVHRGEVVHPVQETLISGNVYALLHRIVERGSHAHVNMTTSCPFILIDGVMVTASQ